LMKNTVQFFINLPQKGEAGKTIVLNLIKK
jgi:hypothetical protein